MGKLSEERLFVGKVYSEQKNSSKRRGHSMPFYTIDELWEWTNATPKFKELWKAWKSTGNRWHKPSIDRLDDFKPYSLDNIQWVTWEYNNKKSHKMAKLGLTVNSSVISIDVYDRELNMIDTVFSLTEAATKYNVSPGTITNQCSSDEICPINLGKYLFRLHGSTPPKLKKFKLVVQLDMNGKELCKYASAKEAMSAIGMDGKDASPLRAAINGRKNSYKGFKWRYDE
jgi:hypothetical protein